MKQFIQSVLTILGMEDTNGEKATPFTRAKAYAIYAGASSKTEDCMVKHFEKNVKEIMTSISKYACFGHTYKLIEFPYWYREDHKKKLFDILVKNNFNVLFTDNNVLLVTWK